MNNLQNLARNTFNLLIGFLVSYALSIISTIYIANYLGVSGFGTLSFGIAFTGIFSFIGDLGLQTLLVKELSRDKSVVSRYFGNANIIKLALALLTVLAVVVIINILNYPQETKIIVYILGLSVAVQVYTQLYYSLFQAYEHMEFVALSQIITSVLIVTGAVIAVNYKLDLVYIAGIYLIANTLSLFVCVIITYFKFRTSPHKLTFIELDLQYCKSIVKQAIPYSLITIFVMTYFYADTVMLSILKGDESAGLYNAAYKLALIPVAISTVCNNALLPVVSKLSVVSVHQMTATFRRYFKYMIVISIPIGVGTTMLAGRFIPLIYGEKFVAAVPALQVLIWSTVFIFLNGAFGPLVYSINKQGFATRAAGVCALFNITGNLIAIPSLGYIGAAYIKAATELLMLLIVLVFCARLAYISLSHDLYKPMLISLCGAAIMGLALWILYSLNIIVLILLSAIVYFAVIIMCRIFDHEDVGIVKQVVRILRNRNPDNQT